MKGLLNFYVSLINKNPQPNNKDNPGRTNYEVGFEKCIPPKAIDVHSNDQNVAQVPFRQEFLYLTIDCLDL